MANDPKHHYFMWWSNCMLKAAFNKKVKAEKEEAKKQNQKKKGKRKKPGK